LSTKYPISEIFLSVQGEGQYVGTVMTFIRLAGCSVGKINSEYNLAKGLPKYTAICTAVDGRTFSCDTNYQATMIKTADEIEQEVSLTVKHVCITGGEPFDRDLTELVDMLLARGHSIHIETSGTKPILYSNEYFGWKKNYIWITVSPKRNALTEVLSRANEIKLLVDDHFTMECLLPYVQYDALLYLQPINGEHDINQENLNRCIEIAKKFPSCRVSLQLHKVARIR
jgi:7-carboxy-7-deazaguanine synthase